MTGLGNWARHFLRNWAHCHIDVFSFCLLTRLIHLRDVASATATTASTRTPLKIAIMKNGAPADHESDNEPPAFVNTRMPAPPTRLYIPAIEPFSLDRSILPLLFVFCALGNRGAISAPSVGPVSSRRSVSPVCNFPSTLSESSLPLLIPRLSMLREQTMDPIWLTPMRIAASNAPCPPSPWNASGLLSKPKAM